MKFYPSIIYWLTVNAQYLLSFMFSFDSKSNTGGVKRDVEEYILRVSAI